MWTIEIIFSFKFLLKNNSLIFLTASSRIKYFFLSSSQKKRKLIQPWPILSKSIFANFHFCDVLSLFFKNPFQSILIFLVNKFIRLVSLPLGYKRMEQVFIRMSSICKFKNGTIKWKKCIYLPTNYWWVLDQTKLSSLGRESSLGERKLMNPNTRVRVFKAVRYCVQPLSGNSCSDTDTNL